MNRDCCCDNRKCKRMIEEGIAEIRKGIKEICCALKALDKAEREIGTAACNIEAGLDKLIKGIEDDKCCCL